MVVALGTEAEVVVRGGDGEALLYQHVYDVEVIALSSQHDRGDVWREAVETQMSHFKGAFTP